MPPFLRCIFPAARRCLVLPVQLRFILPLIARVGLFIWRKMEGKRTGVINIGTPSLLINLSNMIIIL
ncbi:unnamed protein product [Prunus armeniaca]